MHAPGHGPGNGPGNESGNAFGSESGNESGHGPGQRHDEHARSDAASPDAERGAFLAIVRAKRLAVRQAGEGLHRRDNALTLLSVIASAVATVLTAAPALGGPELSRALGSAGPDTPSWRILCGVASICSLLAAVAANLHRQQEVTARLARCQTGAARLETLELQVTFQRAPLADATAEYGRIIAELPPLPEP